MRPLSRSFLRLAVLYSLVGMSIGIMMVSTDDHSQMPTHAHIMVIGFVVMFLYGGFYRMWPKAEDGYLPIIHFVLSNVSFVGFAIGLWLIYQGDPETGEWFTAPTSTTFVFVQFLFAWIVFKATKE